MKKRLTIIVFISVVIILLSSPACKKAERFDIEGTWTFSRSFDHIEIFINDAEIQLIGDAFYGTIYIPPGTYAGTYNVSVSNEINFKLENGEAAYTGTIMSINYIEGTFEWQGDTGTWSASR